MVANEHGWFDSDSQSDFVNSIDIYFSHQSFTMHVHRIKQIISYIIDIIDDK